VVLSRRRRRGRSVDLTPTPALDAAAAAAAAVQAAEAAARRTTTKEPAPPQPAPETLVQRPAVRVGARRRASWIFPIRVGLTAVIGVGLAVLASRAFDTVVTELLIPPITVSVVALAVRRRGLLLRVGAEFVAAITASLGAALLAGASFETLLDDAIDGPRRLITTEWPSPLDAGVVTTLAVALALVTAVAADLASRPRFHLAPLAPLAIGFVGALSVAAPVGAVRWVLVILAVATVALLLARPGDDPRTRVRLLASERSLAATLVGLAAATLVTSTAIAWTDRADPRQDVSAELTLAVLDPVEQMAALRDLDPELDLFRITDRSSLIGPTLPTRWRTSALSEYDGQRWLPALVLRPIGSTLGLEPEPEPGVAPPIEYDLELLTTGVDLVPLPGEPLSVDADGLPIETDAARTVVRLTAMPAADTVIHVESKVAPSDAAADPSLIAIRQVDEISNSFRPVADEIGGVEGSVLDRLREIERQMRTWELDDDAPGAGQQLNLIERFVSTTNRGTRAQFVTAYVLLARSIGVDARVATGFLVPPDELVEPLTLRSSSASVWAEVRLTGLGWIVFDPVPDEQAQPDEEEPPPPSAQSPAAAQPPDEPPPENDDVADEEDEVPDVETASSGLDVWVVRGIGVGAGVVLPVAAFAGVVLVVKWRRRRRRLRAPDPARRIVGAWANVTDWLVDAGLTIAPSWTDDVIAQHALAALPGVPRDVHRLATAATAMTFGPPVAGAGHADDAAAVARSVELAIRDERSRWQRIRWRLSTRSLRSRTKSPVTA
jgi:hypothetical protein